MPTDKLTDPKVRQAKPGDKAYKLFDGGGLFLLVQPGGIEALAAEVPLRREWDVVKLGDAFSMQAGKFLSNGNIKEFGPFPVFGGNGLRGYTSKYTHEGEYELIGRQGALCGNIVVASGQFYATEHAVVVTPKEEMNVGWIASYLTAMNLNRFSESSAQPGLSVQKLSHHKIILPKFPEQEAIDFQIKAIDQKLDSEAASLAKLGYLKSGLQEDLLTGRVRVSETIMEGAERE